MELLLLLAGYLGIFYLGYFLGSRKVRRQQGKVIPLLNRSRGAKVHVLR
jgi:hypothetical protein